MGCQGVPWNVPKSVIITALKTAKGRIYKASEALDCDHSTLLKHIKKDPELVELLSDLRASKYDWMLDKSEDKISEALEQMEDLSNGLKAAFFVLNSKGKDERGWTNTLNAETVDTLKFFTSLDQMQEFAEWQASRHKDRSEKQEDSSPAQEDSNKSE